ncbi:hypothetical protein MUN88_16515 [Gracilibacillus caseinilyticus]|uniref:Matrixin n=1 Tax=Gracilibacillus caseinilyticus TaxID=2932256 RepID=A0ABY4EU99_9BACI|nr:hypothetical protein [Gracilibacillus caseinilyticus]UOQ47641.1 hypothetical protein MUN88_16515 [Gracilibacillus caseinilyticus]
MKKYKNKLMIAVVALLSVFFLSTPVFAHYLSTGYSVYSVNYDVEAGSYSVFDDPASWWEDDVGTNFYRSTSSPNDVYLQSLSYSWFGLYSPTVGSDGNTDFFDIYVNSESIREDPDHYNYVAAYKSSATHEFGHALFLDDLESGWGNNSIMSYERNRNIITHPQPHDISDVKSYQ